jgi:hypothetical protein
VPALVAKLEREGRIAPGHGVIVVPDDLSMDAWEKVAADHYGRMPC